MEPGKRTDYRNRLEAKLKHIIHTDRRMTQTQRWREEGRGEAETSGGHVERGTNSQVGGEIPEDRHLERHTAMLEGHKEQWVI